MGLPDILRRGLGFNHEKDPEKVKEEDLSKAFARLFRTADGRLVLTAILEDLYFFDVAENDAAKALKNYGSVLIHRIGYRDTLRIVNAILDTPPSTEKN
jgi:hypothetical protein